MKNLPLFKNPGEGLQQNLAHKLVSLSQKDDEHSEIVKLVVRRETWQNGPETWQTVKFGAENLTFCQVSSLTGNEV